MKDATVQTDDQKLASIGVAMREHGFLACDSDPIEARVTYDRKGRLRRLHARYDNGWRATLVFYVDGTFALSQAIRLVTKPQVAA